MLEPRPWTVYMGSLDRAPSAEEALGSEPAPLWTHVIGRAPAGPLAVGDSAIAVQGVDRRLTVLNRATGERFWQTRLNAPGATGPLLDEEKIYTATGGPDGRIYAFDLTTGKKDWDQTVGRVVGPIALAGGQVFAATQRGRICALESESGDVTWRRAFTGPIRGGVTTAGNSVFVATEDSLYLLSADEGKTIAAVSAPGALAQAPAISGEILVMASPDGFVAGLALEDLSVVWQVETTEPVFGSPAVARDTVFAVTIGGKLWKIPMDNPAKASATRLEVVVRSPSTPIRTGVLVGTVAGEILWITENGVSPRWRARLDGPVEYAPIVDAGVLVAVDGRGKIHTWR